MFHQVDFLLGLLIPEVDRDHKERYVDVPMSHLSDRRAETVRHETD